MRHKSTIVLVCLMVVIGAAAWASGQSEPGAAAPKELTKVNFQLNWTITGDHAPYYVALKKGWFKEEGLDVNIILGQGSGYTVQALDTGKADIGIADAPVAVTGRAKGAAVKIVGIIFDKHPNTMWFWKDSGITKPQDIAGKTVAVPAADGHKIMWPAFAKQINVNPDSVKFINIQPSEKVAALAGRRADVVFELYTAKPFFEKAIPADQLGHILWSDYGFDVYAHSYVTTDKMISEHKDVVKRFLKAAYRAWDYTLKNPEEAISILSEYQPINKEDYVANLLVVSEFFKTDRYKNFGIGYIDPKRMAATVDTVNNFLGVPVTFPATEMYDSSMLPDPPYKYNF